jgi:hypothetical protein
MTVLFASTIGLGAYLVFVVQPQVGKLVLPLLGGTPAVWNTCIVFFQLALLAGYLYAHVIGRLGLRAQAAVHLSLMLMAAVVLPMTIGADVNPSIEHPASWLFWLLLVRVGAPFFALSATAPLVQRWLSYTTHPHASDPYFLYAASNAGSLLALLTYPVVIEPRLALGAQSRWWATGYAVLVMLMAALAFVTWRHRRPITLPSFASQQLSDAPEPLTLKRRLRWIALAAVPASLMLSVTTYLTTDVAAVPLLWVLPLSIYLLTFIFAFAKRPPLPHRWMCMLLPIVVLVPILTMSLSLTASWWALMLGHLSALFVAAMVCHGELARDRPPVERLTEFYLLMSVGGAVGGLLNALVAPLVFTSVLEYPIGLLAACLLRPDAVNLIAHPSRWPRDLTWAAIALAAGVAAGWIADSLGIPHAYGAALGLPVLLAITQWPRARRYALLLAAAFAAVQIHLRPLEPALAVDRGFFGVVKVIAMEDGKYHALMHGNILHGLQPVAPPPPGSRLRPVSYYAPVRQIFDAQPVTPGTSGKPPRSRVGVVGLGIGTLIACGEPHEFWRFYEINPAVVDMARDTRLFRYLADTPVPYDVVIGEGRLALMREPAHGFDVLILDAFTSDAIPMHLMTREAMSLYFDKLARRGLVLLNISNRYVELAPVLGAIAGDLGLEGRWRTYMPSAAEEKEGILQSTWVVLARDAEALGTVASDPDWQPLPQTGLRTWTDSYSSLLAVIKWTR